MLSFWPNYFLYFSIQMIRLITLTIGGHAYLNFMGNEFGHPKAGYIPLDIHEDFTFKLLTHFFFPRGLNSQCQATISHFHLLTGAGIC